MSEQRDGNKWGGCPGGFTIHEPGKGMTKQQVREANDEAKKEVLKWYEEQAGKKNFG